MIFNTDCAANNIGKELFNKVHVLSSEIIKSKALEHCTDMEKRKIFNMMNELKYEANRIKNFNFARR